MPTTTERKTTERDMFLRLRAKLVGAQNGNGPAHALIAQVRNDAGFSATRTLDAMSMSLWPSRGLALTGYEIKCSRSDWLTELRNPAKAEAFTPYLDHFYLVVADKKIVHDGELPETWGLMAPHGKGLTTVVKAPKLEAVDIDRGMLAAMLRQAGIAEVDKPEVDAAERAGFERGKEWEASQRKYKHDYATNEVERSRKQMAEIEEIIGRDLMGVLRGQPERFAKAVRTALDSERDIDHVRSRLTRLGTDAKVLVEQVDRILGNHGLDGG